jgi:hypothetical protein
MQMKHPLYRLLLVVTFLSFSACQVMPVSAAQSQTDGQTISLKATKSLPVRKTPSPTTVPTSTAALPLVTATLPSPTAVPVPIRAMRVDYKNMENSRTEVAAYEQKMKAAGINMVALGAGRVEWTYFKWADHQANWSNDVKSTGLDFLALDTAQFGKWAQISAVVDVLSPNYIKANPGTAAISYLGKASTDLVSTNELVNGKYGQMLMDMVQYIAANYPVNSISITELFYHTDGYGPDDKALYLAYSGRKDWPRQNNGLIDTNDPSIGDWRTHALDVYLDKLVAISHKYGRQFFLDVGLSLDNLTKMTNEHGTNYKVVLEHTDRIVVWGYYDLDEYDPSYFQTIAKFLLQFGTQHVILSIGLWDDKYPVTPADRMKAAILATQLGGISNIWITPGTLMTAAHWQVLNDLWGPK